uniref:Uncharacterized protein n=1 Tax=Anguilla anguilla TaxID=7936 RepID=A0A0E9R1Z7_ANGAN
MSIIVVPCMDDYMYLSGITILSAVNTVIGTNPFIVMIIALLE